MKTLFLIRHAESKAQTEEEYSFDANLSDKGIKQSRRLGNSLTGIDFDVSFLSPLRRTRQTFEFANFAKEQVIFDSRLVEALQSGGYKSTILPYEYINYGQQDIHNAWENQISQNVKDFICDLRKIKAKKVLVISHGGFLSLLCKHITSQGNISNNPYENYCRMDNCGMSQIFISETDCKKDELLYWNRLC